MSEVFAESLNYKSTKSRAVAARSFRTKFASPNSTKFVDGETVNIDLAGNMPGTYYNFNQMYLKFKVKNANSAPVNLDRCGAAASSVFKADPNVAIHDETYVALGPPPDEVGGACCC